ncbi:MAG: family 16 glycosylhydrolase, partial [Bacteroidota bacterium]
TSPAPFDKILPRGNCDFTNAAILQEENILVQDGNLNLIAKHEPKRYTGQVAAPEGQDLGCNLIGGAPFDFEQAFTSASIFSKRGYNHGFFECRAKIPCAEGLYPVLWMWHHDELVVFEFFGDPKKHFVSAHNKEKYVTKQFSITDYCTDFHTYAVSWTKDSITWYLDEIPLWTICRKEDSTQTDCTSSALPDNDEYSIQESFLDSTDRWLSPNFSLRIYEWANRVDVSQLPDTLIVDYLRIYQDQPTD